MKLKKLTEEQKEDLFGFIDNEGFWYGFIEHGGMNPKDILEDPLDVQKITEALETLRRFEQSIMDVLEVE